MDQEKVEEGLGGYLSIGLLSMLMAIPGLLAAEKLQKGLEGIPKDQLRMASPAVQNVIKDLETDKTLYGGHTASNVVNMFQRTIFREGRGENSLGRKYIALSIIERAEWKFENIPSVLKNPSAYSCWNSMTEDDWKKFKYRIPKEATVKNSEDEKVWLEARDLVMSFYNGKFKSPTDKKINSYYNPDKVSPKWGKTMKNQITVGHHIFGYQESEDPVLKRKAREQIEFSRKIFKPKGTYKVVKGDTIDKIARKHGINRLSIMKNNGLNPSSKLRIGQELKV